MKILEKDISSDTKLISIKGRLDAHSADELEPIFNKLMDEMEMKNFIVELSGIDYLGSSGIKLFLSLMQKLKSKNGKLVLLNMNSSNLRVLMAMQIDSLFDFAYSEEEAMDIISKNAE